MEVAERLNGIGEYYFSQKLREIEEMNRSGEPVINLGIGSPDLAPHPSVIEVLNTEAAKPGSHAYQGYKGSAVLRDAIAAWYKQWYGVSLDPVNEILPMIGSKEAIMHLSMTYLNKGDKVLVPDPGYPTYKAATLLAGGECVNYQLKEENDYEPDLNALEALDLSSVKLMWVNYPHMPTGKLPSTQLFERLIAFGRKHSILICHDNPYSFILNDKPMSILSVDGAKETAVELNSLSKSHNMAGWRVGMLCGNKKAIDDVLKFKSNMDSGMFLPAQLAAAKALSLGKDWFVDLNAQYAERRKKVFELLDMTGCSYSTQQAGLFIWAKVPADFKNGFEMTDKILSAARVFITPGGIFGKEGDNYVRVSLCSTNEKFQEAIERIRRIKIK